jgi:hypothetical protein
MADERCNSKWKCHEVDSYLRRTSPRLAGNLRPFFVMLFLMLPLATEQHNSGGSLKGDAFIITYQTKFEKGPGMETFTLVKRDNRWLLARYFVNSTALR